MIGLEDRPQRSEEILKQRAGETHLLFNREDGQYYALDEVGGRVWELADGTRSVAALVSLLHEEYEAPAGTIEADLLELLEELVDEKLVVLGA